jgi:hypothetical protein
MNISGTELREASAQSVSASDDALIVDLADGRTITVPLAWFLRLAHGTPAERSSWRLIAGGEGIHWPDLDEDSSVESLLAGRRSAETQESLRQWLQRRETASHNEDPSGYASAGAESICTRPRDEHVSMTPSEGVAPDLDKPFVAPPREPIDR